MGRKRAPCPRATRIPSAVLTIKLAEDMPTVIQKPSQMRTLYCSTKLKLSVIPAADNETPKMATTTTQTSR